MKEYNIRNHTMNESERKKFVTIQYILEFLK